MNLRSDERLALAYYCVAIGSVRPVYALPTDEKMAIYEQMRRIRDSHRGSANRLIGRDRLEELLAEINTKET